MVVLAEELNYVRAAARLHISQPRLTQSIQRVERQTGVKLLDRTTRRSRLTSAGETFVRGARRILEDLKAVEADTRDVGAGRVGTLNLGAVNPAFRTLMPRILKTLHRELPQLSVRLHPLPSGSQMRALREGRLDAGILRTAEDDDDFVSSTLINEPLYAVLPSDHRLADQDSILLEWLDQEHFVMAPRDRNPAYFDELIGLYHRHHCSPASLIEGTNMHAQLALVGAGFGVSVQPLLFVDPGRGDVVFVPLRTQSLAIPLKIVHRSEPNWALELFISTAHHEARALLQSIE